MSLPMLSSCVCSGIVPVTEDYRLAIPNSIAVGAPSTSVNVSVLKSLNLAGNRAYRITMAIGFLATSARRYFCAHGTGRLCITNAQSAANDIILSGVQASPNATAPLSLLHGTTVLQELWYAVGAPDPGYTDIATVNANSPFGSDPFPLLEVLPNFPPFGNVLESGAGNNWWSVIWDRRDLFQGMFAGLEFLMTQSRTFWLQLGNPCAPEKTIDLRHTWTVSKETDPFWSGPMLINYLDGFDYSQGATAAVETASYLLVKVGLDPNF